MFAIEFTKLYHKFRSPPQTLTSNNIIHPNIFCVKKWNTILANFVVLIKCNKITLYRYFTPFAFKFSDVMCHFTRMVGMLERA